MIWMIHPTAVIGDPPEHRDWQRGDPMFHPLICTSARIAAYCTVDAGMKGPTFIGERAWLMKGVHIGHDAVVGDDCEIAPHTSVGGHVQLGEGIRVGQCASFKPFVRIGARARIGMGAVVVCDVPAGEVWAGNPARKISSRQLVGNMTASEMEGWEVYMEPRDAWPVD